VLGCEKPIKFDDCSICGAGYECDVLPESTDERLYKIVFIKGSDIGFAVNGRNYTLKNGEGILIFPYEKYEVLISGAATKYTYLFFSVDSSKYSDALGRIRHSFRNEDSPVLHDETIRHTAEDLCKELEAESGVFYRELTGLLSSQLIVYLLRCFGSRYDDVYDSNNANLKICSMVMSYIDSRIYSMKSLSEVALELGYNYSYISTLFRKTCGITLNSYFKTKRMDEAKKLLQDKSMSVSEIARTMNYSSVYAFSKAFKSYYDMSPVQYRNGTKK